EKMHSRSKKRRQNFIEYSNQPRPYVKVKPHSMVLYIRCNAERTSPNVRVDGFILPSRGWLWRALARSETCAPAVLTETLLPLRFLFPFGQLIPQNEHRRPFLLPALH